MKFVKLSIHDLSNELLTSFNHSQSWDKQWINENNQWVLCEVSKSRDWDQEKREWIIKYLSEQIERGGSVIGAFDNGRIVGFSSVDGILCGSKKSYANLTMLFVDDLYQRKGIGKVLVSLAMNEAAKIGASNLFVSAIPSEATVSFYSAMGFEDSKEIIAEFIDSKEDRFLEIKV